MTICLYPVCRSLFCLSCLRLKLLGGDRGYYLGFRETKLTGQFCSFHSDEILVTVELILEPLQLVPRKHGPRPLRTIQVQRFRKHQLFQLTA